MEKQKSSINARKFYALFIIIIPSVLIMIEGRINELFVRILAEIVTFVLQIVVVKGIIDDFYRED